MGHNGGAKLGLGASGFVKSLDESPEMQCALCAYLQEQTDPEMLVTEIDPYSLPGDLCEGHLFLLALVAETNGIPFCECTIARVLARLPDMLPAAA